MLPTTLLLSLRLPNTDYILNTEPRSPSTPPLKGHTATYDCARIMSWRFVSSKEARNGFDVGSGTGTETANQVSFPPKMQRRKRDEAGPKSRNKNDVKPLSLHWHVPAVTLSHVRDENALHSKRQKQRLMCFGVAVQNMHRVRRMSVKRNELEGYQEVLELKDVVE